MQSYVTRSSPMTMGRTLVGNRLSSKFSPPRPSSLPLVPPRFHTRQTSSVITTASASASPTPTSTPSLYASVASICNLLTALFPLWVATGCAAGLYHPAWFTWFNGDMVVVALALTMLTMGSTLTFDDFAKILRPATIPIVAFGVACQYTIMPTLGFFATRFFGLDAALTTGVILVACSPGGVASNALAFLARADVALSVMLTSVSTIMAIFMTPLLTRLLLDKIVPVNAWGLFISTSQVVLLPVLAGLLLNRYAPRLVRAFSPFSPLLAVLTVALICASVISRNATVVLAAGPTLILALLTLHTGGYLIGYVIPKLARVPERVARTIGIETGCQNSAMAAVLAGLHFSAQAAAPCAISAVMHSILGCTAAGLWLLSDKMRGQEGGGVEDSQRLYRF